MNNKIKVIRNELNLLFYLRMDIKQFIVKKRRNEKITSSLAAAQIADGVTMLRIRSF